MPLMATIVPMAVPPAKTSCSPPLLMVVPLAVPPAETCSMPGVTKTPSTKKPWRVVPSVVPNTTTAPPATARPPDVSPADTKRLCPELSVVMACSCESP